MWVKAYVEETKEGLVEILVKTRKGVYRIWVLPDKKSVEVMVDGVLRGRAKGKLRELGEE